LPTIFLKKHRGHDAQETGLNDDMRARLDALEAARAPTAGERTELEGWLQENPTRQEFGR